MYKIGIEIFPVLIFLWFMFTFIVLYIWAVTTDHVYSVWPYISDTGSLVPESCLFGQLLAIGSVLLAITLYIRFLHVKYIQKITDNSNNNKKTSNANVICLVLGFISALGLSIVGNFQETNIFAVHITGAIMAFGSGSLYQIIMWHISVQYLEKHGTSKSLNIFRLVLALISILCFFGCFVFCGVAIIQYNGKDMFKWTKEDGGYEFHLVSTITEWICAESTMIYILTFYKEFKTIKIHQPEVELIQGKIIQV